MFNGTLLITGLFFCTLLLMVIGSDSRAAETTVLSEQGSERATTGPGNNIVSFAGKTHVVWQDSNTKGYWAMIRTLDHADGNWSETINLGPGVDNHARPCITVDSQGYLHVVIGGHNTPMHYRRSVNPNDSTKWTKSEALPAATYPMLACGPDDTLVLAARPRSHNGVDLYVKTADGPWQTRELVFRRAPKFKTYSGYNVALAWGPPGPDGQTLHLAADVYEGFGYDKGRGVHQAIVYMTSRDLGLTWQRADGSKIPGNPRSQDLDVIADFDVSKDKTATPPIVYRNGGVVVDSHNRPYIFYTHMTDGVGKALLVTPDGKGGWRELPLQEAIDQRWPDMHVPGARGQLSLTAGDVLHVQVMITPRPTKEKPAVGRFENRFGLGLLTSRDGGQTFQALEVVPYDPQQQLTQPTLERPVGHNDMADRLPGAIYSVGPMRYPAKGEVIDTQVWWIQPQ